MGADLLLQVVSRLHLAEKELYAFISEVKRISEDEAANVDAWEFVKELFSDPEVRPFSRVLPSWRASNSRTPIVGL